jgi:hypothetical protein
MALDRCGTTVGGRIVAIGVDAGDVGELISDCHDAALPALVGAESGRHSRRLRCLFGRGVRRLTYAGPSSLFCLTALRHVNFQGVAVTWPGPRQRPDHLHDPPTDVVPEGSIAHVVSPPLAA